MRKTFFISNVWLVQRNPIFELGLEFKGFPSQADQLFDPMSGEFKCTFCGSSVEEDESAMPKKESRQMLATFNEQVRYTKCQNKAGFIYIFFYFPNRYYDHCMITKVCLVLGKPFLDKRYSS